jgi:hypothetical protein
MPIQRTYAEEIEKLSNKQNCRHHDFFMKTWFGYYNSSSKMFVAKWFKQSIKNHIQL